jgi:hypothetical protein
MKMEEKGILVLPKINEAVEMLGMLTGFGVKPSHIIYSWTQAELEDELKLIIAKKSKLSAQERALVIRRYTNIAGIENAVKIHKFINQLPTELNL